LRQLGLAEGLRSLILGPWSSGDRRLSELLFGSRQVDAGVTVTEESALTYGPFWSGVTLISNLMSTVPLHYFKVTGDDARERDRAHPFDRLVSAEASGEMSAFQFRRSMQMNALISGNGFAEITRTRDDRRASALHLIEPWRVQPFRDPRTKRLRYRVANPGDTDVDLDALDVLHIMGPSRDGVTGLSVVTQAVRRSASGWRPKSSALGSSGPARGWAVC
jgi:HK97 family phage portal protein